MSVIFLPIKPVFVDRILCGAKRFEYRKQIPAKGLDNIIIYSSYPCKKIVGFAKVESVISGSSEYVWQLTRDASGIQKSRFDDYFKNSSIAYAYELKDVMKLHKGISPSSIFDDFSIPQSFRYVEEKAFSLIKSLSCDCVEA
ncbi:MAG: hypothetical protein ACK5JO_10845 [Halodesulfovibrio sp.]